MRTVVILVKIVLCTALIYSNLLFASIFFSLPLLPFPSSFLPLIIMKQHQSSHRRNKALEINSNFIGLFVSFIANKYVLLLHAKRSEWCCSATQHFDFHQHSCLADTTLPFQNPSWPRCVAPSSLSCHFRKSCNALLDVLQVKEQDSCWRKYPGENHSSLFSSNTFCSLAGVSHQRICLWVSASSCSQPQKIFLMHSKLTLEMW